MTEKFDPSLKNLNWNDKAGKQEFNRNLFSIVAPAYNKITRLLSFGRDQAWKKKLIRLFPYGENPVCLDLACGTGDITRRLAQRFPLGSVMGLDLNPVMLKKARELIRLRNVQWMEGGMEILPFQDESVDIVTGGYALRNSSDLENTLEEIYRVLRKGGKAAFLDFSRAPKSFIWKAQYGLLKFWGNLWGKIFHGKGDVYGYIAESLKNFPHREELHGLVREKGFQNLRSHLFFFGFIEILFFEK
jgi:demethylmenaquinone methyltransferase/2-methoxy-6-polyprenyl-1,4-benzoquinol methylase